jgi:hypothetical protein
VRPETVKIEKRPAGKINFVFEKANGPERWRTLYDAEKTQRPQTMKLNISRQERELYDMREHTGDQITDFEGNDLWEVREEPDANDMTWLFPEKGPGKFKEAAQKKKKKSKKKQ